MTNKLKIPDNIGRYKLSSVVDGSEIFPLMELLKDSGSGLIYIAIDDTHMERTKAELAFFSPDIEVLTFPAWDSIPYDRISPNHNIVSERIKTLGKLVNNKALNTQCSAPNTILITTINAIIQRVIPPEVIGEAAFSAAIGDEIIREELTSFLVLNGYINVGTANDQGEFALRGSIIDIIPSGSDFGYRLDFFGNRLESIKLYDSLTQVSTGKKLDKIDIIPASEIIDNGQTTGLFRKKYRELFGAVVRDDPLYDAVSEGRKYVGMEHWLPLFYEEMSTIFDYMPNAVIVAGHLVDEAFGERLKLIKDSYQTRKKDADITSISSAVYNPIPVELLYLEGFEWEKLADNNKCINLNSFSIPNSDKNNDLNYKKTTNFYVESAKSKQSAFEQLRQEVEIALSKKIKVLIACMSEGSRSRMELMLGEYDIAHSRIDKLAETKGLLRKNGKIGLIILAIDSGFIAENYMIISEQDILGEKIFRPHRGKKKRSEKFLAEATNLLKGELIVHKEHGVGRFDGLETLAVQGEKHDFILLIYEGGDKLYVPVENIDLITRYGAGEADSNLDKLGGLSWQKRTASLKKRIKVAAEELLIIAAEREIRKAPIYDASGGTYEEFAARFPFSETDDQLNAIEDVVEDLLSGKPMDRLICGDVGFGKTEIALRAAFIVASSLNDKGEKGQVAVITPTTLLCNQHYQTFIKRFEGLGVKIKQLSRLISTKEAKKTHELMEYGEVDIVVGTHALLANNIKFNNLSLLIVDEEQRFGVAQKEKLKKLKSDTHVLTLTATPIPRTLQLSLSGIRDLSLIATPPVDRLAVRTYVMPYDSVVIREALLREYYRGGRSFYVCPRVKDVEEIEGKLKELVPEVKVVAAHGQMPPDRLDKIMTAFYDGTYDVLVATTIVESGLDIPMANTLVVHRADMYGLAQLYQIRGRVGRSKVRAYAYLTLPPKRIPTQQAMKRLEVMQKLDSLGAGFSLASHDMDIRGFGNLLGDEQSGTIKEVGVELYQDMLRDAINKAKAVKEQEEEVDTDFSARINIGLSVLIPEDYIADLSLRMGLYRRIANLETNEEIEAIGAELVDRFGKIPQEVENLLQIVKLKQLCKEIGVDKIDAGSKGAVISFHENKFRNPEALMAYITNNQSRIKVNAEQKLIITGSGWDIVSDRVAKLRKELEKIDNL